MAGTQITTSVTIINSLLGFQAISLTYMTTSASTAIAAGSKIEVAGGFFSWGSDETPNASSWTAITTATTAYIQVTPSGTAGSQILTASWTSTAPVWSESKQGWYASAGSNIRVIGGAYKTSATQYDNKFILERRIGKFPKGKVEILTATTGTFTVPSDVYELDVTMVGGGGGGGGVSVGYLTDYTAIETGGGGGGGCAVLAKIATCPGESIAYTIPAAAAGGVGDSDGATGGTVIFGSLQAPGGSGGGRGDIGSGVTNNGGAGGTGGTTGLYGISISGGEGAGGNFNGWVPRLISIASGGRGGSSILGSGGAKESYGEGAPGIIYGTGGQGASELARNPGTYTSNGGNGARGAIVLKY